MHDVLKSIVLLSGGVDSVTTLALALSQGNRVMALSFDYGQRHRWELTAAARIARSLGVDKHFIQTVDFRPIGGSALTSDSIAVPHNRLLESPGEIPVTYVPARNLIFLSLALAWAEVHGAARILIGANAVDYSGYPDCRPEFIEAFEKTANLATRVGVQTGGIRVEAPLMNMNKAEIIKTGVRLGVDYSLTTSCYDPDSEGRACGECDSCRIRHKGFIEAGVADPTIYSRPCES
jgi:7-cyano-7-deazaguanine synthase